ncbi:MAG: 1-deoxy-D-xylulose-5-phosphate reductoisomerase [Petrimonas sp.]|jgi:1-deoxy-D-xylulose-5-phosphate reductoisomerase|uniref:1-deoxy-D-xylulose-5-phosphate reductoisomerase n=1 Tax=Petrimonas sp. TaxID=2023866 RepID=UPI000E86C038|nr:1-deoxy-D-xylulose-5-phosphate reductoisomerase [Petrimonas sp.]NLU30322.1 1-deoxy-D-xylulose-5-phosphate reductoisomerase [Bacteroidales bacterium]BBD45168.1 1-deoxy-D-xylulose 5-phosphate reductoisomerase [Petrimonas sp. IBARAKI]HBC38323.1 1-deoxy-D-xylulose-5-phosphate reductoisomerase [Porphyromonadaceae bacterium]MDD3541210.1 1-deoxy-D-xylulose-5-phosphate reductoisomerase [Petrimonas sp.]
MNDQKRKIAVLGSTGSIGTQALDVISRYPDRFEAYALVANNQVDRLLEQVRRFKPEVVVIANESKYAALKEALSDLPVKVWAGAEAIEQVVQNTEIDIVLTAMVGFSGLKPTISALKARKTIALANKETLVIAGELITRLALENRAAILPVDSEHSAIFQCLNGEGSNEIEKILLTASGGPFRNFSMSQLQQVTREQALHHPNWNMGAKVTIDSSTLMNKGLEMIEARWLFDVNPSQIEIIVHPQSIIHSMVQFKDRSIMAQLSLPDMRMPIQYAFSYPERIPSDVKPVNFFELSTLTFEKPDTKRFRNLGLAYESIEKGGNMPCIMNAANEIAVELFLQEKIGFLQMSELIEQTLTKTVFIQNPSLEDYIQTDTEAREIALETAKRLLGGKIFGF